MTLTLNKGVLGTECKFASRKDRNSPFVLALQSHCSGKTLKLRGNTLEDKMYYLNIYAQTVKRNKGFHE